jgi:hypothetical protein
MAKNLIEPARQLSEASIRKVFDEFKDHDLHRDYFKFPDFERTIRKFNLQLMAGLSPEDPDYSSVCLELFSIISLNA